jgi:molybdopterin-guanine dinucleotide biosynthesis protein B
MAIPPLITIIGKSGTGKTTFLVKLIPALKQHGYKIGTIKHHSHRGFEVDKPGKDSWQHAQAGSDHVIIAAPDKIASYRLIAAELDLDEIAREMADVDLVLVEGYKRSG